MNNFFKKLTDIEAEEQKEIELVAPMQNKLVVVTYEFLDFFKYASSEYKLSVDILRAQREKLHEGGWSTAKSELDKELTEKIKSMCTLTHNPAQDDIVLYDPSIFVNGRGMTHFEPNEEFENRIGSLLGDVYQRICDNVNSGELDAKSIDKIIFFSGLHAKGNSVRFAEKFVTTFPELAAKTTVYSTRSEERNANPTLVKRGERSTIVDIIQAKLNDPYFNCTWRSEQGLGNLNNTNP